MGAAEIVYKDELIGYKYQTVSLCSLYDKQVLLKNAKMVWLNTRKNIYLTRRSDRIFISQTRFQTLNISMHVILVNVINPLHIFMASFHY